MKRNLMIVAALVVVVFAAGAYAQSKPKAPAPGMSMQGQTGSGAMGGMMGGMGNATMGTMMAEDKAMMARRQRMMSAESANDAALDRLVGQMNTATGARKTEAMAAAITQLVARDKEAGHRMMSMEPEMMRHMMGHMMSGMTAGMTSCPMIQETNSAASAEAGTPDHAAHHPTAGK